MAFTLALTGPRPSRHAARFFPSTHAIHQAAALLLRSWHHLLAIAALLALGAIAQAGPLPLRDVPDPLKSWVPWVLQGEETFGCPHLAQDGEQRHCAWPGVLQLKVTAGGASFSQSWQAWRSTWVRLPGEVKQWPQNVLLDGKPAAVLQKDDGPALLLEAGNHQITGQFSWQKMPESLALPAELALLQLEKDGKPVALPNRDESNRLWLQAEEKEKADDQTELHVYRKLMEGVPLLLQTRITLDVSGKAREIAIARMLLQNFIPQELQTALPAKLGKDGSLLVQAKPGHWEINLIARSSAASDAFALPAVEAGTAPGAPLLAEEEIWVYEAAPGIRSVSIDGGNTIDSSQTTLPQEWRKLPAYMMRTGSHFKLKTLRRGDANPDPNKLNLERELWLSFDGSALTVADKLKGTVNQAGRLEMAAGTQLGRMELNGQDQLISIGSQGLAGVEMKRGALQARSASVINDAPRTLKVTGWMQDMESVSMRLHLPPGWRLLHASGPDSVTGSWLSRWNLFDFFLVLITSLAVSRLHGRKWGVLAVLCLMLAYQEMNAVRYLLLPLLATSSLLRVVPEGYWRKAVVGLQRGLWLASLLLVLEFATQQVLQALYPVLDRAQGTALNTSVSQAERYDNVEAPPAAAPAAAPPAETQVNEEVKPPPPPADAPPAGAAQKADKMKMAQEHAIRTRELEKRVLQSEMSAKIRMSKQQSTMQQSPYYSSVDPEAKVQTGPGLPQWEHQGYQLGFSGLVQHDQQLQLYLISPWANRVLTLLRLLLLAALLARMSGRWPPGSSDAPDDDTNSKKTAGAPNKEGKEHKDDKEAEASKANHALASLVLPALMAGAMLLVTLQPGVAQAQLPDKEQLEELKQKLAVAADCLPNCGDIARLELQVSGKDLRLLLDVSAAIDTALPMPGGDKQWLPQQALLDQKPAFLQRKENGQLWLLLPKGHHQVILSGPLLQNDSVQLPLPSKPRQVTLQSADWDLQGWSETSGAADTLQLTRKVKSSGQLETPLLPPLLRVERHLSFDLTWRVETIVRRESPPGVPVLAAIPLLPGEAVTSADITIKDGKVAVNLGPQSHEMRWNATLPQQPGLTLAATQTTDWVETWLINASGRWHLSHEGLTPILPDAGQEAQWVFMPMPGEKLQLKLERPKALDGQTITLDSVNLQISPSERNTETVLKLMLRSSRGIEHAITLPAGASLQGVSINGQVQTLRANGQQLLLPLTPGKQEIEVRWRQASGIASLFASSQPDLHLPASNLKMQLQLPAGRWLLWAAGPGTGPALLFWGKLFLLLVLGYGLARHVPGALRVRDALLLAVGLSQISWDLILFIAAWFILLPRPVTLKGPLRSLAAIGMGLLSLTMLAALLMAVASGLLSAPALQVEGNGSDAQNLIWYLDRSAPQLPGLWALSLPMLVYRATMLLWALWLAWALLGWLKWGWQTLTTNGGLWQRLPSNKAAVPVKAGVEAPQPQSGQAATTETTDQPGPDTAKASEATTVATSTTTDGSTSTPPG